MGQKQKHLGGEARVTQEQDNAVPSEDDVIVVLVGLTASLRKRKSARRLVTERSRAQVYLPWIPYVFGLRASAAWLSFQLQRRLANQKHKRVHLIAYIGGAVLLRLLYADGKSWPIGRVVRVRSPYQEQVAPTLAKRAPAVVLTLLGLRSIVDLARPSGIALLPFPPCSFGEGLIVEKKASALAERLGIGSETLDFSPEAIKAMLPDALDAIALPLSHDEVYDDPRFFDAAMTFLTSGKFPMQPRNNAP